MVETEPKAYLLVKVDDVNRELHDRIPSLSYYEIVSSYIPVLRRKRHKINGGDNFAPLLLL